MDRIFVPIYQYFKAHKGLMYLLLGLSSAVFVYFGLKVHYEEDVTKLLPSSTNSQSELSFGNLSLKDRIFVQITDPSGESDTFTLAQMADSFVDILTEKDSSTHCIDNILYRIDDDFPVMALDYALSNVPIFVDPSLYPSFDKAIEDVDRVMEKNYEAVMEDETGSATQAVSNDPLGLRYILLEGLTGGTGEGGMDLSSLSSGFTMVDSHLFCADSTVALVFVAPAFKSWDSGNGTVLIKELEQARDEFLAQNPGVEVLMHGAPVRSVGNSRAIKKDLVITIGISLILIILLLIISFKSGGILWQNIVPVVYGAFFALSCMYWIKGQMSFMALGIGAIVLGVALSYCLHVVVHHRFVGNAEKMLRDESTPVCLGCITTIGAFMGLLFTQSELLRDFGLFASFALVGNTLFALIFLPHFLKENDTRKEHRIFSFIEKVNSYPYDRKTVLMVIIALIIVLGFIFSPKVGFDTNLKNIGFETPDQIRSAELFAEKNLQGLEQRYYAASGETVDEALHGSVAVYDLLDSLSKAGVIAQGPSVIQKVLLVPRDEQERRIEEWKQYWSEEKITSAYKAIASSARRHSLPEEMFYPFQNMVSTDYSPSSILEQEILPKGLESTFVEESSGKWLAFSGVKLDKDSIEKVDDMVDALPNSVVIDPFYYMSDMVKIIKDDFNVTLLISSLFVLVVLLLSFRNFWISIVSFLPMFLSWYIVQGTMALAGLQFNLINIVISTFIFGIGVDYSIFVMQGLLSQARGQNGELLLYHKGAIFFSAVVLLIVVVSFFLAKHPAIHSIALSTLVGMSSTILLTYTLEPWLFRMMLKVPMIHRSVVGK